MWERHLLRLQTEIVITLLPSGAGGRPEDVASDVVHERFQLILDSVEQSERP